MGGIHKILKLSFSCFSKGQGGQGWGMLGDVLGSSLQLEDKRPVVLQVKLLLWLLLLTVTTESKFAHALHRYHAPCKAHRWCIITFAWCSNLPG